MISSIVSVTSKSLSKKPCYSIRKFNTLKNVKITSSLSNNFKCLPIIKNRSFYTGYQLRLQKGSVDEMFDNLSKESEEIHEEDEAILEELKAKKPENQIADLKVKIQSMEEELESVRKEIEAAKKTLESSEGEKKVILRITENDIKNAKEFGFKKFAKDTFDAIDTLDLCVENISLEKNKNEYLGIIHKGLKNTKQKYLDIMKGYDVEQIEAKIGDEFDANIHDAIFEIPSVRPEDKNHTIGAIIKSGWRKTSTGILLRPVHVGVFLKR